MGFRATVIAQVRKAFQTVGDLKQTVSYTRVVPGIYDPATDTTSDTVTTTEIEVIPVALTDKELEWFPSVESATQKLLIKAEDLTAVPTLSDYVTIDGVKWEVKRTKQVPGGALYTVFIQEP